MKTSKTIQLLCIVLLILPFCVSGILVNSLSNDQQSGQYDVNSTQFEVFGFDEFTLVTDVDEIVSTKTTDELTFSYDGLGTTQNACELYIFNTECFRSHDFYATVNIEYEYSGAYLGRFYLGTEGNCTEDDHVADNAEEMHIAENVVMDTWFTQNGLFRNRASIDDQYVEEDTAHGTTGTSGLVNFTISRKGGILTCSIIQDTDIVLESIWDAGITKPLYRILIGGCIYTDMFNNSVIVTFTDFYAKMDFDCSTCGIELVYILGSFFIGIPIIAMVFRKYKKV